MLDLSRFVLLILFFAFPSFRRVPPPPSFSIFPFLLPAFIWFHFKNIPPNFVPRAALHTFRCSAFAPSPSSDFLTPDLQIPRKLAFRPFFPPEHFFLPRAVFIENDEQTRKTGFFSLHQFHPFHSFFLFPPPSLIYTLTS